MHRSNDADLAALRSARNSKLVLLRAEHAALGAQIAAETAAVAAVEHQLHRRALAAVQLQALNVDWLDMLTEGKGLLHHKERERALSGLGLGSSGFFPETMQRCIAIMMHRDRSDEVDTLAGSLNVVLPYVKPVHGWCAIQVIEPSHDGNYHLRFPVDRSQYQLVDLGARAPEVKFAATDLREALAYIQRHHFFDDAPSGR